MIDQDEHAAVVPRVGEGVIIEGDNWRVVDVWTSYDKHGRLDIGQHVFIQPAEDKENYPKHLWPDYYRDED